MEITILFRLDDICGDKAKISAFIDGSLIKTDMVEIGDNIKIKMVEGYMCVPIIDISDSYNNYGVSVDLGKYGKRQLYPNDELNITLSHIHTAQKAS